MLLQSGANNGRPGTPNRSPGGRRATAHGERDGAVRDTERRAGEALQTMTDDEGLSLREAIEWDTSASRRLRGGRAGHVNEERIGGGRMDHTVPIFFNGYAGLDIGSDNGEVVDLRPEDQAPFAFTGTSK